MATELLLHVDIEPKMIVKEYSSLPTATELGKVPSTVDLYWHSGTVRNGCGTIEWDIPELEEFVAIGIWTEGGKLTDYDGVFDLNPDAIKVLRKAGIIVGREYTS